MVTSHELYIVIVICPESGMENVLFKIKKWFHENKTRYNWHINSRIEKYFSLSSAVRAINNENIQSVLLIPIGFNPEDVKNDLSLNEKNNLEVIIRPPRPAMGSELDSVPHSSLFTDSCIIVVQDTLPAIHKSILRKHFGKQFTIRKLQSENDFEQYFRLRYNVWNEMGYLPDDKQCHKSEYELDYTDRTGLPIGIFNHAHELIASARLVFPSGRESHHVPLIKSMIEAAGDERLGLNFAYPKKMIHPFDLLECFHGFNAYFADLVRHRVRNAEVSRVIVAKEYRGSGLGEVLVDSLISVAMEEQLELLFLACKKDHRSFYEQCGFEIIDGIESDRFADIDQPSIAMFNKLC
ncbi:MAG: GNAT family N-acetyltransferase [Gammaproteobacteria bacterium]